MPFCPNKGTFSSYAAFQRDGAERYGFNAGNDQDRFTLLRCSFRMYWWIPKLSKE